MSIEKKNSSTEDIDLHNKFELDTEANSLHDPEDDHLIKPSVEFNELEEKALWRRVDWHVMPILAGLYLASFLDRSSIGNARLNGLEADLGILGTNGYNVALSVFFATYIAFEFPANLMLKYLKPSQWLSFIAVAWGLVMTCMGFSQNFHGLLVARIFLGVTEAGLFPGAVAVITFIYPRSNTQLRTAIFISAATLAGSLGGLLAYAIGFMNGLGGYQSWRYIFIIEGLATIVLGVASYWIIVDSITDAKFLNSDEKNWLNWRKAVDSGKAGEAQTITAKFVLAACTDWQVYLSSLYCMGVVGPVYSLSLFLPTLINSFGTYTRPQVQLITIPVYFIACCWVLGCAYLADRQNTRFRYVVINQCLCLIGFTINIIPTAPNGLKYFALIVAASGAYAGFATVLCWLGNNLAGSTKRSLGLALQICIGNIGAIVASNVYRSQDSPHYYLGHGTLIGIILMGMVASPAYAYLLMRENNKRAIYRAEQLALPEEERRVYTNKELREMGDRAPDFIYTI